jgi:hypothetical protein
MEVIFVYPEISKKTSPLFDGFKETLLKALGNLVLSNGTLIPNSEGNWGMRPLASVLSRMSDKFYVTHLANLFDSSGNPFANISFQRGGENMSDLFRCTQQVHLFFDKKDISISYGSVLIPTLNQGLFIAIGELYRKGQFNEPSNHRGNRSPLDNGTYISPCKKSFQNHK